MRFKNSVLRILALVKKECIMMWLDKGTRKILIIPIIVQCIVFGYGASFNLSHVPYVLLDESHSVQSLRLSLRLEHNHLFTLAQKCISQDCFVTAMNEGQGLVGLHLPPDFDSTGDIYLITDARNTAAANTAAFYLNSMLTPDTATRINYRFYFNEHNLTRYTILSSMILALSLIQVLLLSALTVAREREDGNFDMLLMTPANSAEILVGKALPPAVAAFMQSLILFLICRFYFGIELKGSVFLLFGVVAVFDLAVVGVGLAVSAIARTAQQALISAFIIALPCIILSGLITPLAAMPEALQFLVKAINPLYYGIEALQRIYLEGACFADIWYLLLPLIGCAFITMPVAMYLFRHHLD